jgi:hypothetical protein
LQKKSRGRIASAFKSLSSQDRGRYAAFFARTFFMTFPAFKQEVQTVTRFGTPFTLARTVCKLGNQRLLVRLWACETEWPNDGFFPHSSHIFDIVPIVSLIYRTASIHNRPKSGKG